MTPEFIKFHVNKNRVSADFRLSDALSGPLATLLAGASPVSPLPPVDLSGYTGQGLISLTYDDGLLDNFTHAAALHLKHGIPANFAIVAKRLFGFASAQHFMTPDMCRVLHDLGFEISSHGLRHSKIVLDMTKHELHQDTHLSKWIIEQVIGVPGAVTTYCVPFSNAWPRHVRYMHKAYSVVRQAGSRMNTLPLADEASVLSFPLTNQTTFGDVQKLIDSAIEHRTALVLMLHGICRNDARPAPFELRVNLLNQILDYIAHQGPKRLLPVRLSTLPLITHQRLRAARARIRQDKSTAVTREGPASLRS